MGITFTRPPVNEVVVGKAFVPRGDLLIPHMGEFWATRLKDQYPEPAHALTITTPNEAPFADPLTGLPLPRIWLTGRDRTRMVQLQQDRIFANWRRLAPHDEYARFPAVRDEFNRVFELFDQYVTSTTGQAIKTVRYEVTYVNLLYQDEEWADATSLRSVFRDFGWSATDRFLSQPTKLGARFEFALPDDMGTLSVTADPARHNLTQESVYRLQLIAVAPVDVVGRVAFSDWLDIAHDQIVRGFKDLTTETMHDRWGLVPEGNRQ